MEKNNIYFKSIDLLRGLAALSVLFFHITQCFFPDEHWLKNLFWQGHLGVEVFFVITGFVIPYSIARLGEKYEFKWFLIARFFRLFPAYWSSLILVLMVMIFPKIILYPNDYQWFNYIKDTIFHVFLLPPYFGKPWFITAYWSLAVEFQFYVLVGLIFPFLLKKEAYFRFVFYTLFSISAFLSSNIFCTFYAFIFLPGIVFALLKLQRINFLEFAIVTLFSCIMLYFQRHEWTRPFVVLLTIAVMLGPQFTLGIGKKLGDLSYSIYLLHIPLAFFIYENAQKIDFFKDKVLILLSLSVAIILFLSNIQYLYIEKPMMNLIKKIKK